jgi:hypothetical protein
MIERLEQRTLLTAVIQDPINGLVQIRGTEWRDEIVVEMIQRSSGRIVISVTVTSAVPGQSTAPSIGRVFGRSEVGRFDIMSFDGDDFIEVPEFSSLSMTSSIPPSVHGFIGGKLNVSARVDGGAGDDWIFTGGGDDTVNGGAGNDRIDARGGNDRLLGDDGRDSLFGGHGNDSLRGGAGRDTLRGSYGDDLLDGGDGRDSVTGNQGKDVRNEGAYDATPGERIRFEGILEFVDTTIGAGFGTPSYWQIRAVGGDFRDALDVDITGSEERADLLRGKRVVATGHIEIRNIVERSDVRVLILDSLKPA